MALAGVTPQSPSRSPREIERYAVILRERQHLPAFGDRPVKELRRRDIVALVDDVARKTPYQAIQPRAHLSRMMNWLVEREVIEASPLIGARPRRIPPPRQRVLSDEELSAVWRAALEVGQPYGPALRFIILTGLRKSNASWLRWVRIPANVNAEIAAS
jgi:integrase